MITLDGEDKPALSLNIRFLIFLFVTFGFLFLIVKNWIAVLFIALPALALAAFILNALREKIRPKFHRFSKEAKKK